MREILKPLCAMAMMCAIPTAAVAQGANAFDGTYRGVSLTVEKSGGAVGRCPAPSSPTPPTLMIGNGAARAGGFEGTVTPQGLLKMKSERAFVVEGRIDALGNVQAQGSGSLCSWNYVWQKAR